MKKFAALGLLLGGLSASATTNLSTWVYPGTSGRLNYRADYLGNRIVDASGVGYKGGAQPFPSSNTVPVRVTISPVAGDNTASIQNAINQVSAMPQDANGFRGAVLLNTGTYPCSNTITISASGVVLRGVGSSTNGSGTVLQATASNAYTLVHITGSGSASTSNTHNITNNYVPVGARSFLADSVSGFAAGDRVYVRRVATEQWIHDIGMDLLTNPWTPDGYNIDMQRVITRIEGNRIFVDTPITCAIDRGYTNGTIREYTWPGRISNCGIEHIYGKSDYFGNNTNEDHGWIFVQFNSIENGWARDLVSQYFGYACVALYSGTKQVTVSDCQLLDPISIITGGRRYAFVMDDCTMCLVRNCYTRQDRHQFVTQSLTTGPNVFVDGVSDSAHAEAGPHHRWATAAMWDNITVNGHDLDAQNTCESGTGHGWEGANCAIWNSTANKLTVASPPGARNWLIGSIGTVGVGSACHGIAPGPGTYESSGPSGAGGTNVYPNSLYFSQLQDRLAAPNLQTREYWLGEITSFSNASPSGEAVTVDAGWRTAVQSAAGGQALDGFDLVTNNHWVPFTFNFSLGGTDQIVGATLTLSMRATNSAAADMLYLGSITNGLSFSALNWLPVSSSPYASNATVRVLDLASQLNLLTNGQLNLAAQGDIGIDWAMLELEVAPRITAATIVLEAAADATVRGGTSAAINFGTASTLSTKNDSTADNTRQAYLRWDLSAITQSVLQARIKLTPINVGTNGIEQGVAVSSWNNWTETGITWNNQPGRGERFATWIPATNTPVTFDVTPQALDALANDDQLSLQLLSIRNVGGAGLVDYASREATDPNTRPQLILSLAGRESATIIWNGPGAGANNWSASGNWLPAEVPEASDDLKFYDAGATGVGVSNVNNFDDAAFGGVIASLQYGNTNGNHTTLIAQGKTLSVIGTNGLIVGTETDNGNAQTVFATMTGLTASLALQNSAADLIVRQGTAGSGGSQRATLDLSGLGNLAALVDQILVGVAGPVNRPTGTLILARTNVVMATGSPGILAGDSSSNTGGQNLIHLGQTNAIFADSITIARQKANASLRFNGALANPAAFFRAADGVSRVNTWVMADNSLQSTSSSSALGTNDFSAGRIDALVNMMVLGKSQKTTGANSTGVLTFSAGTIDVNTLQVGYQAQSGATSAGIGRVILNGSAATLSVNTLLELGHTSGGAGTTNTFGELVVNGGSVLANSISAGAGSGINSVAINNGLLVVSNAAGTATSPLASVALTNSILALSVAASRTNLVAVNLTTGGASNLINIAALAGISAFPAQFPLIKYAPPMRGAGYNFVLGSVPTDSTRGAYLSNNAANASVDLIVIPRPAITSVAQIGGNLVFAGTNGISNWTYYVLASTNLALPAANWSRIATNLFDNAGNFQFTNTLDPNQSQCFYRLAF